MFSNRIRSTTITLLSLSLSLLATSASADGHGDETPWMIQLVLASSPDGFEVMETYVVDCEARDWKTAGSGITVELADPRLGDPALSFQMRDPRLVFVEPPDESRWFNEELVASEDALMFPRGYHVLSFPIGRGEMPELPLGVQFSNESGKVLLAAVADPTDVVPGDEHGCIQPEFEEATSASETSTRK